MSINTELTFEAAIEHSLVQNGGYKKGNPKDYSPELGLFKYDVIHFLQETQPHLNRVELGETIIVLPKKDKQQSIVDFIETETTQIYGKIEDTKKLIELLKEYRTALISEVVTGKVKVI